MGQDDQIRQGQDSRASVTDESFRQMLAADRRNERRLAWGELAVLAVVIAIVLAWLQFVV